MSEVKLTGAEQIVADLITKVGSDVSAAIKRAISLAPDGALALSIAAASTALAFVAASIDDTDPLPPMPDERTVLSAALLTVRSSLPQGGDDPFDAAMADVAALEAAGRLALEKEGGE